MWNADRSCAIVFNGEIYNYRHLRNDLESRGARFLTASDTEVILEGWRIEGEAILPKLEGMFAFAIWDSRTAEWIMARDRWGIKPLYLSQPTPGTIAFASEIKPLLGLTANRAVNLRVLYEYLLYSWCPGPQTIFEGIRHLEPGHLVRWKPNDGDIRPRRYCGIDSELGSVRPTDLADAVRSEFDRSVADHMIADVPVGLTLSGGLDSSCVLASMARLRDPSDIDAFTIGFGLADDETPFAATMAKHAGARHHVRQVCKDRISADFAQPCSGARRADRPPRLADDVRGRAICPGKGQGGAHRRRVGRAFPGLSAIPHAEAAVELAAGLAESEAVSRGLLPDADSARPGKHDRAGIPGS